MPKEDFDGAPRSRVPQATAAVEPHCTLKGVQGGETAASCSRARCVGVSSVISEENATVYSIAPKGLVVRREDTPSSPLDQYALLLQGVLRVGKLWLNYCHQEGANMVQRKGIHATHSRNETSQCSTGIRPGRMRADSDDRESHWNSGQNELVEAEALTLSSNLSRLSVASTVSRSPAQSKGVANEGNQLQLCYMLQMLQVLLACPWDRVSKFALFAWICLQCVPCWRTCCALASGKAARSDTLFAIKWQVLTSNLWQIQSNFLLQSESARFPVASSLGTFQSGNRARDISLISSALIECINFVESSALISLFGFFSAGIFVLEFFTDLTGEMQNPAEALRLFDTFNKKAKDKAAREQREKDAQQRDGLGFSQAGRDAAEAGEAKLQLERVKQEDETRKEKAVSDKILMEIDVRKATEKYAIAAAAKGDPMAKVAKNARALVTVYNKCPVKQTALPTGKGEDERCAVMQLGVSIGSAIAGSSSTAEFSLHDAMSNAALAGTVLKIKIEAEIPLKPGQALGVEDVAHFWRSETEIPIGSGQIVSNTGPWLNPVHVGKVPIPSFYVVLRAGDQDEMQKLRDLLMITAKGDPILIGGVATFWTAETPHNVNVEFHASESAQATLYMALCDKAEIPRSLLNAMLAESVRNSLESEAQNNQILSVSLEGARFSNPGGGAPRARYSVSALDLGGPPRFSPALRINMTTAASAHELAQAKKRVNLVLGTVLTPLVKVTGTTAAKTTLQQGAGLAEARKKITQEVDKKLQITGAILASLREVAQDAGEGRGEVALKKLLMCQTSSAGNSDVTAEFLYGNIIQEVKTARTKSRVTPEQGEELAEKVVVWECTLSDEREKHKERGEHLTTLFQLTGFPKAMAKPWQGKDQSFMREIQALYNPRNNDVQKDLQRWFKDRELLKILCCVPILDEEGVWNPEEGVMIATQHAIGFGQAADAAEKILPRPKTLLTIFADNKQGAKQKKTFQVRVAWPTAGAGAPIASVKGAELQQRIEEILRNSEGIWVPEVDKEGETLCFVEGKVIGDVKISDLGEIDASATHDVRNLHTLMKVDVENCESLLEVVAKMQHEKLITPVAKLGGSVLFVATGMAETLQHVPGTAEVGVMKDEEWMVGMQPGESARDWLFEATFKTLWHSLECKLDGGVWIRGTSFKGQQGLGALDGRDTVEEGGGKRWWRVLAQKHFVGNKGYDDIAEMVVRAAIERKKAVAITKQGATLLLRPDSIFVSAVLAAENMTPGDPIPTETLPLDGLLLSASGREMKVNLLAVGRKWAPAKDTQDNGEELINSDIQECLEKGEMTIEFGMWAAAGPITSESFIIGKRGEEVCLWRPKNQGAAMVFVEGQGQGLGACKVHRTTRFQAHDIPTLTSKDVMGQCEIGKYGVAGPRILKGWVEKGQGAHFQTGGGHVVVIPEVVSVNGQVREFTFEEQFTVGGQEVDIDGEDPLTENLMALEPGTTRATLEKYSDKAGKIKIEAAVTGDPTVLSGVKWDMSGKLLLLTRAEEAPAAVNMKDKVCHPLVYNQRGMAWINKLILKGSTQAVQVGPVQGQALFFNKTTDPWCADITPETAQAWDPLTQTMQNLREAVTIAQARQAGAGCVIPAEDQCMGSGDEALSEEDLPAAEEDSDGTTAGAARGAAPRGKGEPSPGTRGSATKRKNKQK